MKKSKKILLSLLFILLLALVAVMGYFLLQENVFNKNKVENNFTIQYEYNGINKLDVTYGAMYSLPEIPVKTGYTFKGLFDTATGGTQYIKETGASSTVFSERENLVLYVRFEPVLYTVVFDFQGGKQENHERSVEISYGNKLTTAPTELTLLNMDFVGWFTKPSGEGELIADPYAVIPNKSIINENLFNLDDPNGFIYLYAHFIPIYHTLTLFPDPDGASTYSEEIKVAYGTALSEIITDKKPNGKAVLKWAISAKGEALDSKFKIISDKVLYAVGYAPYIEFDTTGGTPIRTIVAAADTDVWLPEPVKINYQFVGWHTSTNEIWGASEFPKNIKMPENSLELTAKWQAIIFLDSKGGTAVNNITKEAGADLVLPITNNANYIFAGWYDNNGKLYTHTAMPENSLLLTAKYYEKLSKKIVLIPPDVEKGGGGDALLPTSPNMTQCSHIIDLKDIYESGVRNVTITANYLSVIKNNIPFGRSTSYMAWFSDNAATEENKIWEYSEQHAIADQWDEYSHKTEVELKSGSLFVCRYSSEATLDMFWTDFYITVEYPDTSKFI